MAFPDDVAAASTANNTNVTTKTATASIHPADVGGGIEAAYALLLELYALFGGVGDLQAVTSLGNSTSFSMYAGASGVITAPGTGITTNRDGSSDIYKAGTFAGGIGLVSALGASTQFISKDLLSGFFAYLSAGALTASRQALMPDEGDGAGLDSTLVIHTTKDPITIGTATNGIVYDKNSISIYKSGLLIAAIDCTGATPLIKFIDSGTNFYSTIQAGTLSADHTYLGPNKSGTFALTSDIQNLLTPTIVKTANYTAAAGEFVPADTTSGAITVTLPTAPADKTTVGVKLIKQASSAAVTVRTGGSDVIDVASGATSVILPCLFQCVILQYVAATSIWYIVSGAEPVRTGRVQSAANAATLDVNVDYYDTVVLSAISAATVTINAPTGSPNDMALLAYRLKDNGTARALSWNASFRDGATVTKPITTAITGWLYVVYVYNAANSKWDLMSVNQF